LHFAASLFKKPFLPHGGKFRAEIVGGYMLTGPSIRLKSRLFIVCFCEKAPLLFGFLLLKQPKKSFTTRKGWYPTSETNVIQEVRYLEERVILHCDLNHFYALVELLSRPALRHMPLAVCGSAQKGWRA
jgi:hypothetical protein